MGGWWNVNECKRGVGRWWDHCKHLQKQEEKVFSIIIFLSVFVIFFLNAHLMKTLTSLCKIEQNEVHIVWGGQISDVNVYNR